MQCRENEMYLNAESNGRRTVTETWCNNARLITKICLNIYINIWYYYL